MTRNTIMKFCPAAKAWVANNTKMALVNNSVTTFAVNATGPRNRSKY
ncbi:unannotated protein [freshwater metagenome]|uniref:Unannotated protein n=1 Tax=freshwater metagenome TaxID=449393 RepID=A0A6J6F8E5_9ZZZZ